MLVISDVETNSIFFLHIPPNQIAALSVGRDLIGVTLLGNMLFAVGGYDGQQYLKIVEKYDAEKNEWIQTAPLNFCRSPTCVVAVPNVLTASTSITATSPNSTV